MGNCFFSQINDIYLQTSADISKMEFLMDICRGPLFRGGKLFAKTPFAAILTQLCPVAHDPSDEP